MTVYAVLPKPNSMLGQAAAEGRREKESSLRCCDTALDMHMCRKTNQCLSQAFAGCVLNVCIWTHTYVWRQANAVSYSWLCQSILEFSVIVEKVQHYHSGFSPSFFGHVLVAVLFLLSEEHLKAFHGLHTALYLRQKGKKSLPPP